MSVKTAPSSEPWPIDDFAKPTASWIVASAGADLEEARFERPSTLKECRRSPSRKTAVTGELTSQEKSTQRFSCDGVLLGVERPLELELVAHRAIVVFDPPSKSRRGDAVA
mmetsp:Transcript_22791/g.36415  ORF Transcript_22791/g.36415 Transcript_22791/m.36415 type:complete len:111 (+) Transcript_22791:121-453(+)